MNNSLKDNSLVTWLTNFHQSETDDKNYRHLVLKENPSHREQTLKRLKTMVNEAHNDARLYLRKFSEISLDPLDDENIEAFDPTVGYPSILGMSTLKGYFGEIFAGLIVENYLPFNENNWRVPIFFFRFHEIAFDQLETYKQTGEHSKTIPGRTGDDCLAFVIENQRIKKVLFCEAKCTSTHSESMIKKAHQQVSDQHVKPIELRRMLETLQDYDTDESREWIKALRQFWTNNNSDVERYDFISYVCGQSPKKPKDRISWIPHDKPHDHYTGGRKLESVEIHLEDVDDLINYIYNKGVNDAKSQ